MGNEDNTDNTKDKIMETEDECHGNKVIEIEKKGKIAEMKNEQKIEDNVNYTNEQKIMETKDECHENKVIEIEKKEKIAEMKIKLEEKDKIVEVSKEEKIEKNPKKQGDSSHSVLVFEYKNRGEGTNAPTISALGSYQGWQEIEVTVDSGACDTVMPISL